MNRIVILLQISFLFSLWSCNSEPRATTNPELPNIVVIYCDDLGYGDLGCFGNRIIRTPNVDRMATEGIRFTEFYSASPVCSPSRAALLTGRIPQRMGINSVFFPRSFTGMPLDEITTADLLKKAGYAIPFIVCEDWGWWVEVKLPAKSIGITCYRDHDENTECEFVCSPSPEKDKVWNWPKFRFVDIGSELAAIRKALRDAFEADPEIEFLGESDEMPLIGNSEHDGGGQPTTRSDST